MMQFLFIYMI